MIATVRNTSPADRGLMTRLASRETPDWLIHLCEEGFGSNAALQLDVSPVFLRCPQSVDVNLFCYWVRGTGKLILAKTVCMKVPLSREEKAS